MQTIPLQAVPNQTLKFAAGNLAVQLKVYQKLYGLVMDVLINSTPIATGCLCLNQNRVLHNAYLGFPGDLAFVDTQGSQDPSYTGLGSRWRLIYLTTDDVNNAGLLQ